jgi:hypothetical protein
LRRFLHPTSAVFHPPQSTFITVTTPFVVMTLAFLLWCLLFLRERSRKGPGIRASDYLEPRIIITGEPAAGNAATAATLQPLQPLHPAPCTLHPASTAHNA